MSMRHCIRTTCVAWGFLAVALVSGCEDETTAPAVTPPGVWVNVTPLAALVAVNAQQQLTATVGNDLGNDNAGVTWTVSGPGCSGAACGTLSAAGSASGAPVTYTAPATWPNPADVTVTATSVTDPSKSAAAAVTITSLIQVSITPTAANLDLNAQQLFTATLTDDPNNAGVIWTLTGPGCPGAACGTLSTARSASGTAVTYTAPATWANPADVTITATSVTDNSKSAAASVTITSLVQVSITPTGFVGVDVRTTRLFTATVSNDPGNLGSTWTLTASGCAGAACGSITPSGAYTAPAIVPTPATVTVTATSIADDTKLASATVVITTPGVITVVVSPTSATICTDTRCLSHSRRFTAYVFHDPSNAGVAWSAGVWSIWPTSSASGVPVTYTAPTYSCGSTFVTATSVADATKSATATVMLYYPRQPPWC